MQENKNYQNEKNCNFYEDYTRFFSEDQALWPAPLFLPLWFSEMYLNMKETGNCVIPVSSRGDLSKNNAKISAAIFEKWGILKGFLFPVSASWMSLFDYSGMPFLPREEPALLWANLLVQTMEIHKTHGVLLRFIPDIPEVIEALEKASKTKNLPLIRVSTQERAAFFIRNNFSDWYEKNFSKKRRKEFKRLRTRLQEEGDLSFVRYQTSENPEPWITDFLNLEAKGWKGKRKTALLSSPNTEKFFRNISTKMTRDGHVLFWKMTLNQNPIAMAFAITFGEQVFLVKIAYDENFAKYSPGVLLILSITEDLCSFSHFRICDSCAIPNHPMINHLWYDRLVFSDFLVGNKNTSKLLFSLIILNEKIRRNSRNFIKLIYNKLKNKYIFI